MYARRVGTMPHALPPLPHKQDLVIFKSPSETAPFEAESDDARVHPKVAAAPLLMVKTSNVTH